jgi:probable rRNA maturation factor
MAIELDVSRKFSHLVQKSRLRQVAAKALRAERAGRQTLTIVIRGDAAIRALNRKHLHIDAPTDVLSFSSDQKGYLGDIVISYETARRNARIYESPVRDELELLVVHGVLHLLGYEDSTVRARDRMWKRQNKILGLDINGARSDKRHVRIRSG